MPERKRDRLRQTILEDIGWTIYRIWLTDWIKDSQKEGTKLLEKNSYKGIKPKYHLEKNDVV